jgi:hypothetical protein
MPAIPAEVLALAFDFVLVNVAAVLWTCSAASDPLAFIREVQLGQ